MLPRQQIILDKKSPFNFDAIRESASDMKLQGSAYKIGCLVLVGMLAFAGGAALAEPAATAVVTPAMPTATTVAPTATMSAPAAPMTTPAPPAVVVANAVTQELAPGTMVRTAVPVVKAVLLLLFLASVLSWTLLVVKCSEIIRFGASLRAAIPVLQHATTLANVDDIEDHTVRAMLNLARNELDRSGDMYRFGLHDGIRERVQLQLQRIEDDAARRMSHSLGVFATIGSVTPFVGLFGTVWGIMHSFIGISRAQTTSLAVIAPGIAEALLATSLGLVAAVPATIMYNALGRRIGAYRARLVDCGALVLCLVSRDADRSKLPAAERARVVSRV